MNDLLNQLAYCIESGKESIDSPYPNNLKGKIGAYEITKLLLDEGVSADHILKNAMMVAMNKMGEKFSKGEVFVPDLLIAAKAMKKAMEHLIPYFNNGSVKHRGTLILGTVKGDLHDIGKNLVGIIMGGGGWNVVDLGTDVSSDKIIDAVEKYPDAIVGMSALLTTTMGYLEVAVQEIKNAFPATKIFVGGAPLNQKFSDKIGADGYFPDPHSFSNHFASS